MDIFPDESTNNNDIRQVRDQPGPSGTNNQDDRQIDQPGPSNTRQHEVELPGDNRAAENTNAGPAEQARGEFVNRGEQGHSGTSNINDSSQAGHAPEVQGEPSGEDREARSGAENGDHIAQVNLEYDEDSDVDGSNTTDEEHIANINGILAMYKHFLSIKCVLTL